VPQSENKQQRSVPSDQEAPSEGLLSSREWRDGVTAHRVEACAASRGLTSALIGALNGLRSSFILCTNDGSNSAQLYC
jgi:hypothetical protein